MLIVETMSLHFFQKCNIIEECQQPNAQLDLTHGKNSAQCKISMDSMQKSSLQILVLDPLVEHP